MATNFPTSLDNFTNPVSGNTLDSPSHSLQHSDANDAIEAIEAKLGVGASPAGSATAGQVLTISAAGTSGWSTPTRDGLVLINTTSFSAQSSVSLPDNTFTTTYSKYLIDPKLQCSAGGGVNIRLRASGTDTSGTVYRRQFISGNNTSVTGARITGSTSWINIIYVADSTEFSSSLFWLHNPKQATYTSALVNYVLAQAGDIETSFQGYGVNVTTAYDSLTLLPASGTITGSISVYGCMV